MCGYCVEGIAINAIDVNDQYVLSEPEGDGDPLLETEVARLYRSGMRTDRGQILKCFQSVKDIREREMIATLLLARDEDRLFLGEDSVIRLPLSSPSKAWVIDAEAEADRNSQNTKYWWDQVLGPALDEWDYQGAGEEIKVSLEFAYALLLATAVRRHEAPKWISLIKWLSEYWEDLYIPVTLDKRGNEMGWRGVPGLGDLRLWLRREARRALWEAGKLDEFFSHGIYEPDMPVLSWLVCSRVKGARPIYYKYTDLDNSIVPESAFRSG